MRAANPEVFRFVLEGSFGSFIEFKTGVHLEVIVEDAKSAIGGEQIISATVFGNGDDSSREVNFGICSLVNWREAKEMSVVQTEEHSFFLLIEE